MAKDLRPVGELFPVGGRLAPEQMIGREGDVADLAQRLLEREHVLLCGPRRIGKTTVCGAVCQVLESAHGCIVVELEAPEQSSAEGVCQLLIDRTSRLDLECVARGFLKGSTPFVQAWLSGAGVPLDLSEFQAHVPDATLQKVLELPLQIARQHEKPVVLFIDELQRAVDYADGEALVSGLVDLYAGGKDVLVLVDGSGERTIEKLIERPYSLAKLTQRVELETQIPEDQWWSPLKSRFQAAALTIADDDLHRLISFGNGHPYRTMAACASVALAARRAEQDQIDEFVLTAGLGEARRRLDDDNV